MHEITSMRIIATKIQNALILIRNNCQPQWRKKLKIIDDDFLHPDSSRLVTGHGSANGMEFDGIYFKIKHFEWGLRMVGIDESRCERERLEKGPRFIDGRAFVPR